MMCLQELLELTQLRDLRIALRGLPPVRGAAALASLPLLSSLSLVNDPLFAEFGSFDPDDAASADFSLSALR